MHALQCALSLVSLVFGEVFFGGSASLHILFLHFLAKCFFCNLFWGIFLRGGSKCKCAWWMVLEWKAFENGACSMF